MKKIARTIGICAVLCVSCLLQAQIPPSDSPDTTLEASLQVYDRENRPLRAFLSARQTYAEPVSLDEVSPWFVLAVVETEDRRFYQHNGIDKRAILRALWQNIRHRVVVSGASTITQQLARLLKPRPKTWRGKWAEAKAARAMERHYTKEEILTQYINRVELGNQTQGVQAAAEFYFSTSAKELSLAQAALLAGLIQSPSRFNPLKNPSGALARRNRVLNLLNERGLISQEQYQLALEEPLGLSIGQRPFLAPHFVQHISRLVKQDQPIYTTLDKDIQEYAEQAVRNQLAKLTEYHVTNAAVVVLDNEKGEVLAYVGSADFNDNEHAGQINGVLTRRQPGSALKPFVYALAMQQNGLTAASILEDEDTFFEGGFRPRNYDEHFHGGVSVRRALACSYNVPVIKAAEKLGAPAILQFLHQIGFASLNRKADFYGLAIALGGGEVTLLELANAYATLARGGVIRPVVFSTRPRLQTTTAVQKVLPADISYIITDILSDNAARADAFGLNSPLSFPFPAAAKTGTSKDYKDNFAIAYTPRLTVAAWAGNFDASSMQKVSGISGAAPIMHDVMMFANQKYPSGNFVPPAEVVAAHVCSLSGLLAGENCFHTREEFFTQSTVPQQVCDGKHDAQQTSLQIIFPVDGDIYAYDSGLPPVGQQLHIQSNATHGPCQWQLNGQLLPQTDTHFWWPLQQGRFELQAVCREGGTSQTARSAFTVL